MSSWFQTLEISASGLTAERLRMDVIAGNIANANTTRTASGEPYRRRQVVLETRGQAGGFASVLGRLMGNAPAAGAVGEGVRVVRLVEDAAPFRVQYDPTHPDADAGGYVRLPNIDTITEMVDLMAASRSYEANVTALNTAKAMAMKALEIGR